MLGCEEMLMYPELAWFPGSVSWSLWSCSCSLQTMPQKQLEAGSLAAHLLKSWSEWLAVGIS